jgi:hypothetical protein
MALQLGMERAILPFHAKGRFNCIFILGVCIEYREIDQPAYACGDAHSDRCLAFAAA